MDALRRRFMNDDKPLNAPGRGRDKSSSVIELSTDSEDEAAQSIRTVDSDPEEDVVRRPKARRPAVIDSDEEEDPKPRARRPIVESDDDADEEDPKPRARRPIVGSDDDDDEDEEEVADVVQTHDESEEEIISVPSVAPPRASKTHVSSKPSSSKLVSVERTSALNIDRFTPSGFPLADARRKISGSGGPARPAFAINTPREGAALPRAPPSRPPPSVKDAERIPTFELFAPKTGQTYVPPPRSSPAATTPKSVGADGEEVFNMDDPAVPEWEMPKSATEVEQEMHNLLAGVAAHEEMTTVDMTQAIVPGLADGVVLKPHQVISRQWMREREEGKKRGGILADDMGLGKTIQVIVRVWEGRTKGQAPTLIVVPTSVVTQWKEEFEKFAPRLSVIEHHGPSRTRSAQKLESYHVIITSYPVVQSEHKNHTDSTPKQKKLTPSGRPAKTQDPMDVLFRIEFHRVVLDEAHTIKNRLAKTTKACLALLSAKRWCLTGTPLQNNVDELYPLFAFIGLRPLDDWEHYKAKISDPVKKGKTKGAMNRLQVVLKPTMLRRLKTDQLEGKPLVDLPERRVNVVVCEFDEEERAFYQALQDKMELAFNKFLDAGTVMSNYTAVLTLLLRLRQACNHPKLVTKDFAKADLEALEAKPAENRDLPDEGEDPADDLVRGMARLAVDRTCSVCLVLLTADRADKGTCADCGARIDKQQRRAIDSALGPSSAKIRKVIELLTEIKARGEGEKTIVFSQFTSWFDIVEDFLTAEGIKFTRLDGSMKKSEREVALRKIKSSKRTHVILVSFKAGSTGLNLTCCNNVILVDLWWNPALEEQAFDRAHRLGQERDVDIYKLTIENTVEDRILQLQETKRELARAALSGEKMKGNKLGLGDLLKLFRGDGDDEDDE